MTSTPVRSQPMPRAPNLTVPAATALAEIALKKTGVTPKPTRFPAIFLSTPQWLNLALGAIGGSLALSLGLGLSALQSQRAALELFAQDTAPATLTTLRIQDSLAGLDASVANELLLPPGDQLEARQEADDRQKKLANYWIQIAHNLSYGNRELRPITTLQLGLGDYLMAIERARVWHGQGRATEALRAYQDSTQLLDQQLFPAVRALGQVKAEQQARAEHQQQAQMEASRFGLMLGGLGLVGYLVAVQWFLSQRTRRTLNPALVGAMVLTLGLGSDVLRSLDTSAAQLTQSKTETFGALVDLRTIRTLAYSAHADVNRALLDPTRTLEYDTSFQLKLNQIVRYSVTPQLPGKALKPPSRSGGLLMAVADTLQQPEEAALVAKAADALYTYRQQYEHINRLDQQGQTAAAIALTTGYQTNQLNGSFELFRDAHHKLIEIELAVFDQRLGAASRTLDRLRWQLPLASVVILGLTVFGIQCRLREYRL